MSVIIPAYNEENRLRKSLPPARDYLQRQDFAWEVIVIDDGSSDNTAGVSEDIFAESGVRVIRNPGNRGKGYSVRQGVFAARGEILLFSDADFSTPVREFTKLYSALQQGYDVAIGSRSLPDSNVTVHQAWYREGMGRLFNRLVRCLVLDGFIDTQCGFKAFRKEVALPIFSKMTIDRFSFDVEFLYIARKRGLRIKEIPVEWENVLYSRVNIVRDSARMLFDLFKIRWNNFRKSYDLP
ncbi:MAG: glycosyltransferase family 2 protein [Nitrospinae bacterium]|nr:glycosyltransferase family 2 protein [Nitrospinota bacterium]